MPDEQQLRVEASVCRPADLHADGWQTASMLEFMRRENIPGASVAVIDQGGVAWSACYGVTEAVKPEPVTPETRFQAASISKPVAALTGLTLVAEGQLNLDEDIAAYQATWRLPPNHAWQARVTLRQLFSHAAGLTVESFPGYTQNSDLPSLEQVLAGKPPANTPPVLVDTLPGLQFRYSGGGYTVLQKLLEDVTRQPFWRLAQERVLDPLGMQHSTYQILLPDQITAASGHRSDGQPLAGRWHNYPESAAAGLWTTPLDLAKLVIAFEQTLAGTGEPLLPRRLVEEILTPQIRLHGIGLEGWEGLGWFLTQEGEHWYYGHGGSNEGFRASIIARKGRGQAAVIMSNSDSGWALSEAWEAAVAVEYAWSGFAWTPPAPVALPPGACAQFAGEYTLDDGKVLKVVERSGGLALKITGQPALEMVPKEAERFFLTQLNLEVQFTKDGMVLKQNGTEFIGRKRYPIF